MLESIKPKFEKEHMEVQREVISFNGEQISVVYHPSKVNGPITLIYPGFFGDIDGYNQKYTKIAAMLADTVGPVLRADNRFDSNRDYSGQAVARVERLINYMVDLITQNNGKPEINLAGFSAGAGAVAVAARNNELVKKILLIAPSADVSKDLVKSSLKNFNGDVFIGVGDVDRVVGQEISEEFARVAPNARLCVINGVDHQFTGRQNGMVFSSLFNWAFREEDMAPGQENGIVLY